MGKLMLKANVVKKPALERVGLNSLRDFFLDVWAGLVVGTDEEAEKHLSDFIETNNEEKILNRLDKGKVFLFFIADGEPYRKVKTQPSKDAGYEFKTHTVDDRVSLVYIQARRSESNGLKFISSELSGHYRLLKRMGFEKKFVKAWMNCRMSDKIICIEEINTILGNELWTEGFLNYNSFFTFKEYQQWVKQYEIPFQIRKGFRKLLSDIIKQICK